MKKKNAEDLTLDDMGEFLKIWQAAYEGMPPDITRSIATDPPTIDQYLESALGQLYMYRLVSPQDLKSIVVQAVDRCSEWTCISFGIGLEAGLGHIDNSDAQAYLSAFNQPYVRSLLGLVSLLLKRGKLDESTAQRMGGELSDFIDSASVQLANSGQESRESVKTQYEGTQSPVVAYLREIDVSVVRRSLQPASATAP
jgi:hypothetical protein